MLKYIHEFCVRNEIRYFMYFGTLLGAVRHHGFIPWDDDMDICMPRRDYEKFLRLFPHDDSGRYKALSGQDPGNYTTFAKIVDTNTVLIEPGRPPIGINIDLFPIDNEGQTLLGAKLFLQFVNVFIYLRRFAAGRKLGRTPFRRAVREVLHVLLRGISDPVWIKWTDAVSRLRRRKTMMRYVGAVNASAYNPRQILRGEWFQDAILLDFEDSRFFAPCGYAKVLETIYVNYMDLPAVENRKGRHGLRWIKA